MGLHTICGALGVEYLDQFASVLEPIGCALNKMMDVRMYYHSAALVDCQGYVVDGIPLLWRLNTYYKSQLEERVERGRQLNDIDVLAELSEVQEGRGSGYPQKDCVAGKAEPLIRWLLEQKKGQVSHWALFRKAREIYGDSIVALGVIGEMFAQDAHCPSRKKSCVLNNRMKPLFPSDQTDDVGHNYHFWSYLSIALTNSEVTETIGNYVLEWLKDNDAGDYSANRLGIKSIKNAIEKAKTALAPPGIGKSISLKPTCRLE